MRAMRFAFVGGAAAIGSGCASAGHATHRDPNVYLVEVETAKSEIDVEKCLKGMSPQRPISPVSPMPNGGARETSAYGSGTVSNYVSHSATPVGKGTLRVRIAGSSYLFPDSGEGAEHTNRVAIPASDEVRARVDGLAAACT